MTNYRGGCLCGAVRFSVDVSKKDVVCCHCSMCRRWGGGPALSVMGDGPPRFENETALRVYKSSAWGERVFCGTCGTSVLWRSVDGRFQSVPVAAIEDPEDLSFTMEIFVEDKPDYYDFAGERTRMTGAEVIAAFNVDAKT